MCVTRVKRAIRHTAMLAVFSLLFNAQAALAQTQYNDSTFDVANDWTIYGPYVVPEDAGDGAFSAMQVNGINPQMEVGLTRATVPLGGSVATWGAVINNTLVWDPAEDMDGALGKIDMSLFIDGGGAWSLAVKQGDFVWYALQRRAVLNLPDPLTIEIDAMIEEDFVALPGSEFVFDNQPMHPDFSAGAPPISFGVGVGRSCPTTSNCTTIVPTTMILDDLQITAWPSVPLNPGHNGNWWGGPGRSGEGVQLELSDDGDGGLILVATIYSYDTLTNQIFMIAVGPVEGDTSEFDVFITDGGLWGDEFDPALVTETQWGTGTIRSCGCDNLLLDLRPNDTYKARGYTNLLRYDLVPLTTRKLPCPYVLN